MSIEITLICDGCGRVIDGGSTAKKVRDEARTYGSKVGMPGGLDYCPSCVAARGSAVQEESTDAHHE